jgi:hypothetical protein
MIDPKDFNKKKIKMIHTSVVRILLNEIMSANRGYIEQNRQDQNIVS